MLVSVMTCGMPSVTCRRARCNDLQCVCILGFRSFTLGAPLWKSCTPLGGWNLFQGELTLVVLGIIYLIPFILVALLPRTRP